MPSTSNMDLINTLGTPKGGLNTPKTLKYSKTSKNFHTNQPFKIGHQRVNLDVDLARNKLEGFTEITILPSSNTLKLIKLDCRGINIKQILVNNSSTTNYIYNDKLHINGDKFFNESLENQNINLFDLYSKDLSINQHHFIRQKLNYIFGEVHDDYMDTKIDHGNTEELVIVLPDNLKLELMDINLLSTPASGTLTPLHLKSKATGNEIYTPINIRIDYNVINPKDGVNFINTDDEKKFWHAYTTNSNYNISTSSWVPCIDNLWDRCTWSLEINVPRKLKDITDVESELKEEEDTEIENLIGQSHREYSDKRIRVSGKTLRNPHSGNSSNSISDPHLNSSDIEDEDEDSENFDIVVCSGDFNNVKETPHPNNLSKKVVSWSIFNPVCAHHIGWALGCFESLVLSSATEIDGEEEIKPFEEKDTTKSAVTIYCLPDQLELAKNTCIFANSAVDFYLKEFGSFPFSSYAIVFIKDNIIESNNFAGLSIIDSSLLYPSDIIEPMISSTDMILESIASQWSGINIVPQTFNDIWCTIGIARFMSFQFLKKLMGTNFYRFKIKSMIDEIVEKDIGKKPLGSQFFRYPISDLDFGFIRLKAPIVLFILDKRMTKTDKSFGLSRVLPKLFLQAMSGDLQNSTVTSQHFQYVCEKVNRNKLESFFKQWIEGVGTPIFRITQKFNKKRGLIEMSIRQTQQQESKKIRPDINSFINDSISYLDNEPIIHVQPVFTGPLTIRVHEMDGTPYEHIVDIKEGHTKLDIQYNSKLKRLKKMKEESEATPFNKFGDVLTDEGLIQKWNFTEWDKLDDETLFNDAFEWIRVDVDFEWIAKFDIKQPDYMYNSQLMLDRDLEAQFEAIKYFGNIEKPLQVHCSTLTRTIMDKRYFYGIRIEAARALAKLSNSSNNFLGVEYLIQVYKELYCFQDSFIPKANDFNDFNSFFLQNEFPKILSNIKHENGDVPYKIKTLLLNLLKYNENSSNNFNDCFYISDLICSLTNCLINENILNNDEKVDSLASSDTFLENVVEEIKRLEKLDEWIPSYQNIILLTCLKQKVKLARYGLLTLSYENLLYYTLEKYPKEVRIEAFHGLFVLGGLKNKSILQYFLKVCLLSSGTYFRTKLIEKFLNSISIAAIKGTPSILDDGEFKTFEKLTEHSTLSTLKNMIIIEDGTNNEMNLKRDNFARATLNGSIELLRRDYSIGEGLKSMLWELIHSSLVSIYDLRNLFNICQILYKEIDQFFVRISVPSVPLSELKKKIVLKNLGEGKVVIKREGRFKIQLGSRKLDKESSIAKDISKSTNMTRGRSTAKSTERVVERSSDNRSMDERREIRAGMRSEKSTALKSTVLPTVSVSRELPESSDVEMVSSKPAPKPPAPKPPAPKPPAEPKLKLSLNLKQEHKKIKPLVTVDKFSVTFKLPKETLNKMSSLVVPSTISSLAEATSPTVFKVGRSSVNIEGTQIKINFKGAFRTRLRDIKVFKEHTEPSQNPSNEVISTQNTVTRADLVPETTGIPRYIKIFTKRRKILVSSTPFEEKNQAEETKGLSVETVADPTRIKPKIEPIESSVVIPKPSSDHVPKRADILRSSSESKKNSIEHKPKTPVESKVRASSEPKKSSGDHKSKTFDEKPRSTSSDPKTEYSEPKSMKSKSPLVEPELRKSASPFSKSKSIKTKCPLVEPEPKTASPFSKSNSPFSQSTTPNIKKKKSKIYIHAGDTNKSLSSPDAAKNGSSKEPEIKEPKKTGFKLKLNLK
jgi:transcription initiation factor TFIID subunit 2